MFLHLFLQVSEIEEFLRQKGIDKESLAQSLNLRGGHEEGTDIFQPKVSFVSLFEASSKTKRESVCSSSEPTYRTART